MTIKIPATRPVFLLFYSVYLAASASSIIAEIASMG